MLGEFFKLASVVFQDRKDQVNKYYCKLCLLTLLCLVENREFVTFMHNPAVQFDDIKLYNKEQDRFNTVEFNSASRGPLALMIVELVLLFMSHNTKKQLQADLYSKSLDIIHALFCAQKRLEVRLKGFQLSRLWECLIRLVEIIVADGINNKQKAAALAAKVLLVFNMTIVHGNEFLPLPRDYDDLFYEFVRRRAVFDSLNGWIKHNSVSPAVAIYSSGRRYQSSSDDSTTRSGTTDITAESSVIGHNLASDLSRDMGNVMTIIHHFSSKIEVQFGEKIDSASPAKIIATIKDNYDSLNLKAEAAVDRHQEYLENPNEVQYFQQLIRTFVSQVVAHLSDEALDFTDQDDAAITSTMMGSLSQHRDTSPAL